MSRDDVPVMALEPLVILDLVLISWVASRAGGREHRGVLWQQKRHGFLPRVRKRLWVSHQPPSGCCWDTAASLPDPGSRPWVTHVTEQAVAALRGRGDHQGGLRCPREDQSLNCEHEEET